jgi:hypothetical protein
MAAAAFAAVAPFQVIIRCENQIAPLHIVVQVLHQRGFGVCRFFSVMQRVEWFAS